MKRQLTVTPRFPRVCAFSLSASVVVVAAVILVTSFQVQRSLAFRWITTTTKHTQPPSLCFSSFKNNRSSRNSRKTSVYKSNSKRSLPYVSSSTRVSSVSSSSFLQASSSSSFTSDNYHLYHYQKQAQPVYLSDLPSPCFLLDVSAIEKRLRVVAVAENDPKTPGASTTVKHDIQIPPIYLKQSRKILVPVALSMSSSSSSSRRIREHDNNNIHTFDLTLPPANSELLAAEGICYLHSRVVQSRDDWKRKQERKEVDMTTSSENNDEKKKIDYLNNFLVQFDLPSATTTTGRQQSTATTTKGQQQKLIMAEAAATTAKEDFIMDSHLVLGLNNHHVISYYWARSAGSGAAMEAPGVVVSSAPSSPPLLSLQKKCTDDNHDHTFDNGSDGCLFLKWSSDGGFADCNSNDGKRSEWVNYLKHGDQVQLVPHYPEQALLWFLSAGGGGVYGVSSKQRPLGSEPVVVCEWKLTDGEEEKTSAEE